LPEVGFGHRVLLGVDAQYTCIDYAIEEGTAARATAPAQAVDEWYACDQ